MPTMKNKAHIMPKTVGNNVIQLPCELDIKSVERGVIASLTDVIIRLLYAQKQKNMNDAIRKNNAASGNLKVIHPLVVA